jgi:hypothetical protein
MSYKLLAVVTPLVFALSACGGTKTVTVTKNVPVTPESCAAALASADELQKRSRETAQEFSDTLDLFNQADNGADPDYLNGQLDTITTRATVTTAGLKELVAKYQADAAACKAAK